MSRSTAVTARGVHECHSRFDAGSLCNEYSAQNKSDVQNATTNSSYGGCVDIQRQFDGPVQNNLRRTNDAERYKSGFGTQNDSESMHHSENYHTAKNRPPHGEGCALPDGDVPSEWISQPVSLDEWRQFRHLIFMNGTNAERLAFKIIQDLLLSPTVGLPLNALRDLSDMLARVPQRVKNGTVYLQMRDLPPCLILATKALSLNRPVGLEPSEYMARLLTSDSQGYSGSNQCGTDHETKNSRCEPHESNAAHLLADNMLYFFEGGGGRVRHSNQGLGCGQQLPIRGQVPGLPVNSQSMRENNQVQFDDRLEHDSLYQHLLHVQARHSRPVHHKIPHLADHDGV